MKPGLSVGVEGEARVAITPAMAMTLVGDSPIAVLSTPSMLWYMEMVALNTLVPYLDPGEASVGSTAQIAHLAPTPIGMTLTTRARVTAVDGRKVSFVVEAFDDKEKIGEGTHDRFVIDVGRFARRVESKKLAP